MEFLSYFGIFCIAYVIMCAITFADIISEAGIEDDGNPLMFVFFIFMFGIACMLSVFWPVYWFVKIKDHFSGDNK